jgi:hypothetical protein
LPNFALAGDGIGVGLQEPFGRPMTGEQVAAFPTASMNNAKSSSRRSKRCERDVLFGTTQQEVLKLRRTFFMIFSFEMDRTRLALIVEEKKQSQGSRALNTLTRRASARPSPAAASALARREQRRL